MEQTTEKLLTFAPLGAGLALMLSDHRRLGMAVALISPVIVFTQHPRGCQRALRAVPRSMRKSRRAVRRALKETGKSLGWLATG